MARNKGTALTEEDGMQAIQGIRRLQEISRTSIITPNLEAEKVGIQKFLENLLVQHADELLACWSAVRFEYEPLVGAVSLVVDRILSIRNTRLLARQVAQQAVAPPENPTAPLTKPEDLNEQQPGESEEVKSNIIHIPR